MFALDEAVKRLGLLLGASVQWSTLSSYLPNEWRGAPERARSAMASHFAATLELVKRGEAEIRQDDPFGPLWLRAPGTRADGEAANAVLADNG